MVSPSEEVLTTQREAELRDAEAHRADAVHAVFDTWTANAPPGRDVEWIDVDGIVELLVEERGRRSACPGGAGTVIRAVWPPRGHSVA